MGGRPEGLSGAYHPSCGTCFETTCPMFDHFVKVLDPNPRRLKRIVNTQEKRRRA